MILHWDPSPLRWPGTSGGGSSLFQLSPVLGAGQLSTEGGFNTLCRKLPRWAATSTQGTGPLS